MNQSSESASEPEIISGIFEEDGSFQGRRVTIIVYGREERLYCDYLLHPTEEEAPQTKKEEGKRLVIGLLSNAKSLPGYIFHLTEDIFSHDLLFMRQRVREEADRRGLGHIRGLGF